MRLVCAIALALTACAHHAEQHAVQDVRAAVSLSAETHEAQATEAVTTVHRDPERLVTRDAYDVAVFDTPDGGTLEVPTSALPALAPALPLRAVVHHPAERVRERGAVEATKATQTAAVADTSVKLDAGVVEHAEASSQSDTRPSWGLNLWLVLLPAGLIAAALAAWRLYRWN